MKNINLLALFLLFFAGNVALAQQKKQELRILDLYVIPDYEQLHAQETSAAVTPSTTQDYIVGFKVNHPEMAKTVHILWGDQPDRGNIKNDQVPFKLRQNKHYLSYNNQDFVIRGYEAYVKISVPKEDVERLEHLTLFVEGKDGKKTEKLSTRMRKHPKKDK